MKERIRFDFGVQEDARAGVEDDIGLAIFTAECVHGRPQTRLDVGYLVGGDGGTCVVEVRGPAGETALRVFTGLCSARFGDGGFTVERVAAKGMPR